ncbi:MAG: sodium:calcium antiporter [Burkholderiales bacterium 12-64-5]|nr:MAG: sodium:calcium antiporter [Burkholderiales bacterium 12-64-5]
MDMLMFVAGLGLLIVGAEVLVRGASLLALSVGVSPLVIGLTVVAFGTSAPEVAVSLGAVLNGETDIAIGNVIGSNIFNVFFILGASALIAPLMVSRQIIRQEVPIMIGVTTLFLVLAQDHSVGFFEAAVLLVLLLIYTGFLVVQSRRNSERVGEGEGIDRTALVSGWAQNRMVQIGMVVAGLVCLVIGSRLLVSAAVSFAAAFGVSDLVIGLTIVAAGTSLPEVATSIMAAIRGERDIAVGNVVGSNVFNILGCLGLSGLAAGFSGIGVAPSVMAFDAWVMLAAAIACLPIFLTGREIARWEGAVFLAYYMFYVGYMILAAEKHDALVTYTFAMVYFVIPITLLTAAAVYFGRSRKAGQ